MKQGDLQWELDRNRVASQEALDGQMMGLVAVLALDNARDLSVVDAGVKLLEVEDLAGDDIGIAMPALVAGRAAIDQAEHAVLDEPTGFLTDDVTVHAGDPATLGDGLIGQYDAMDDLVVMLNRVGKAQGELLELLRC